MAIPLDSDTRSGGGLALLKGGPSESHVAEMLHSSYGRLIYHIFQIFGLSEETKQDLFNQVFLKILRGLKKLKHTDNLKSWVATIARNDSRSYLRHREKEVRRSSAAGSQVVFPDFGSAEGPSLHPIEKEVFERQLDAAWSECVDGLEAKYRVPFLLRYREIWKWEDVASTLGITVNQARRRAETAKKVVVGEIRRRLGGNKP